MSADTLPAYEWKTIPWTQIQKNVFKLQTRIYRASQRGDVRTVRNLQRLMIKSRAAKCLAVRRVTQDNRGKRPAGVDGIASLPPSQRLELVQTLSLDGRTKPVRRVWIPKPGKTEKRPLGIPTMRDRAAQTLARLALEPEWEARFEPNSYGFRPGRSCQDAMEAIHAALHVKSKYVLDADIASCFDRINHDELLKKLNTFPLLRRAIQGWLKAGVMDGETLFPTDEGTPQGGAISPLLANVALHGLESHIRASVPKWVYPQPGKAAMWTPAVIRYADDFVAMHEDLATIEQIKQTAADWLRGMGLELKPSKTRISHTLHEHEGIVGFDFLGFTVRQFAVSKHRGGKGPNWKTKEAKGFKTIIKPSKDAQKRHLQEIAQVVRRRQTAPQKSLIQALNPKIIGWANYYSTQASKVTFSKLDALVYRKLWRWARRRHGAKKTRAWVAKRYWQPIRGRKWTFAEDATIKLAYHGNIKIKRHTKVDGTRSPLDGDAVYWATRLGRHPELSTWRARLLKEQKGGCAWCGQRFLTLDELIENDHIVPKALGGADTVNNRQLLHGHCHDLKTAQDGSNSRRAEVFES